MHADSPAAEAAQVRKRLPRSAILIAGLAVGLAAGALGLGYSYAEGTGQAASKPIAEDLYLEYRIDPDAKSMRWADAFSAPDTYLLVRFQTEPQNVYVTPAVPDDAGFPQPQHLRVPRAFADGELAYVYLMDDDSLSDQLWKDLARDAARRGGAVVGQAVSGWTLGMAPADQVLAFFDEAGRRIGETTLDGNDCLAWTQFPVRSVPMSFEANAAKDGRLEYPMQDRSGREAAKLKILYGHPAP